MSFPLPSGPYQGLFSPEPLNELPGLPLAPLPSSLPVSPIMAAPSVPPSSMPRLGSPTRPDWATILSLVLPAVIAAMKGGGAAPLGAFYRSFGQARSEQEARQMEQEEMRQKRQTEQEEMAWQRRETARKEREAKAEQARQHQFQTFRLEGELARAETPADFRRLQAQVIRAYQEAGKDFTSIAAMTYNFAKDVQKIAHKKATEITSAYSQDPKKAEETYGFQLEHNAPFDTGIKGETGKPILVTPEEMWSLSGLPATSKHRPITKAEAPLKPAVPNTVAEQDVAFRAEVRALRAVGKTKEADVVEAEANSRLQDAARAQRILERPAMVRDVTPNEALNATLRLRDRFVKETQAARMMRTQYDMMRASMAAVRRGDLAAGSQGVLVTFQKTLDVISVVREAEYARSASGLSLLRQIEGQWMKIEKGGAGVPIADLETFVRLAGEFVKNQDRYAKEVKDQIDSIAKQFGLDPTQITTEFFSMPTVLPNRPPAVLKILERLPGR